MLVRFLRDFQSKHTGDVFYRAGQTADLVDGGALLVSDPGVAEAVPLVSREGQVTPKDSEPLPFEEDDAAPVQRGRPRKAVR